MSDIYSIANGKPFYLVGDWNSCFANLPDYIEGIDVLSDYTCNNYGDILCEFLMNINCCLLNGRKTQKNDFTFMSTRGSSVMDYCIVPCEQLHLFDNFEVIRAQSLVDKLYDVGQYDP